MCDAFARRLPSTYWAHAARRKPELIADELRADGHALTAIPYVPHGYTSPLPLKLGRRFENRAGLMHIQEAASMLPPLVLDAQPGELVLDLCAAPGGKSAQLALQMQNRGTLVVNDLSFERLRALRATQERLGLRNLVLCAQDGSRLLEDHPPVFDRALVDVPCSCEGTLRKRGKWSFKPDQDGEFKQTLVQTQRALLLRALSLTRAGGRVVYSTCTLDPLENEGVVAFVLEEWSRMRELDATLADIDVEPIKLNHFEAHPGITSWEGRVWSDTLKYTCRVYPQDHDTGGFFIASLRLSGSHHQSTEAARAAWRRPEPVNQERLTELLRWSERYYGLTDEHFRDTSIIAGNTRYLSGVSADLITPPADYQVAGLPIVHTRGAVPRLTSAAALEWGRSATRGVCDLDDRVRVDAYYRGESQTIDPSTLTGAIRSGLIVRHQGIGIGLGDLSESQSEDQSEDQSEIHGEAASELTLKSGYPKRLRLAPNRSAFEPPQSARRDHAQV